MATGVTAESVLSSIIQGHLECSICHTRYQQPKMLHCSHSFCLKCLQELKQSQHPNNDKVTCPLCQRETNLPEGGVDKLNTNYTLISLVEEVTKQEQLLKGERSTEIMCQTCEEENEAISRCTDCEQYMCKECQQAHMRFASLKTHKITALSNQEEFDSKTDLKNTSNCVIHPSQKLCFYCQTCEQLICRKCTTSGHKDPLHNFVDFDLAVAIVLQQAHEINSQVKQYESSVSRNWKCIRNRLGIMLDKTKRDISNEAKSKVVQIKLLEMKLLQEAQAAYRKKDKRLAEVIFAQQAVDKAKNEMNVLNHLEILKLRQDFLSGYKEVKEEAAETVDSHLSFTASKESCDALGLGTLKLKDKWELMDSHLLIAASISVFSSGNIVLYWRQQCAILTLNDQDHYSILQNSTKTSFIRCAQAIAVNMDDDLLILDNYEVKVFNKEFHLLHQFRPNKEADIDDTPSCLAVDDKNVTAVGYRGMGQISLHNPDGSLIRVLPAPAIEVYLTISNKHLIYSCSDKRKLISMDYQGNNIFTVDSFQNSIPHGLCCDEAGDVFVVAHCQCIGGLKESVQQVHHYSQAGNYISVPVKEVRGNCICYIPDGKIAVTGEVITEIYHRV